MVRVDFTGRARQAARAIRVGARREPGIALVAEAGPHLPFKDGTVDELFVGRAVAWRTDIAATLDELWRVSKPGALIHLTLPHASSVIAASRDAHPRPLLTLNTFNYYDPRLKPADAPRTAFAIERARLRVAGRRGDDTGLALARGPFAQFIEKLANGSRGSQYRFERWFANLIGGFEEFDVALAVIKDVEKHPERSARLSTARASAPSRPPLSDEHAATVDPNGLRVTSDVAHEAAAVEPDAVDPLPNAAPAETGPPYVSHPSGDRGEHVP
ncbi:MAG: methyltransferase domain-containing protein [Dehalococcoidia bacterium]